MFGTEGLDDVTLLRVAQRQCSAALGLNQWPDLTHASSSLASLINSTASGACMLHGKGASFLSALFLSVGSDRLPPDLVPPPFLSSLIFFLFFSFFLLC